MNQAETLLEIKDLCVEFKTMAGTVRAVDHLSYSLKKGEKLGIVGDLHDLPGTYDFFKPYHPLWKADRRIFASAPGHEKERSHGGSNPHDGGSRHCQSGSSCL